MMAPTIQKRTSIRARASRPSTASRRPVTTTFPTTDETFRSTKEDKRRIKHSSLISRIEKANTKTTKRRRPSKKLITTLESLADALPNTETGGREDTVVGDARIRHKSLKSRPGAMKKKDKLEKLEVERFNKNMAQMAQHNGASGHSVFISDDFQLARGTANGPNKWAALRGFITSTLDRNIVSKTK